MKIIKEYDERMVRAMIDSAPMNHNTIAGAIGMTYYSFSDRYIGRVQWKLSELKELARVLRFDIFSVINI